VRYLKRSEINTEKWDDCVNSSTKPLIYGQSWYLDAATKANWDGLVWGDYDAVFPMPWNKKFIVKQVYTPNQLKQLNIYFKEGVSFTVKEIEKQLQKFSQFTVFSDLEIKADSERKTIQVLDISGSNDVIFQNYKKDRRKDIRRKAEEVTIMKISVDDYLSLYELMNQKAIEEKRVDLDHIARIYKTAHQNNSDLCYSAIWNNKTVAIIGCLGFLDRIYLLTSGITIPGYKARANVILIHKVIQQNKTFTVLDFVGSSIKGIQDFNKSFGAEDQVYYANVKQNQVLSKIKKIVKR